MKRLMLLPLLPMALLVGCQESTETAVLTMKVSRSDFKVEIPARGELEAKSATPVSVPGGLRGPQSLAWILDNFSEVTAGDVVARLDGRRETLELELEKYDFDKLALDGDIQAEKNLTTAQELVIGRDVTEEELNLSERFFTDDERVYTKIDIIDQMRNKDYLQARLGYFDWGKGSHDAQATAELDLIRLKQKGIQAKIATYQSNLSQMEITAPHDGLFVMQPGWSGALPMAGDMVWSGIPLGTLPDTSVMQAKLWVLESEAVGLAVDKPVVLTLDAYPDKPFTGKVTQVDALAKPKDRDSPVNYFEFTVTLDVTDTQIMLPGRQVQARVSALSEDQVLAVPNQAIFQREGRYWVYVKSQDGFIEQTITPGSRSLNRTVILEGLKEGDVVALTVPRRRTQA
ncbi:efflux RND transporter periplasmic adaptor subunit [Shewanella litorisediminis]|uniref:Efflux RND transporter periplasmic adaptor subunit n=1 Tax=Shewanella litorisediminis TaxID=1173586 RepID=A0ABX7G778_9GAMM|nr:HlyD family efflux transporter periplasmic adaptor subunit [Shewanella litorisediminis]MCL2916636.1 efflux RND transporter periplasmic adaptor subunit [Shewanella litorisediminis]QRH03186.1 efflux RND transporter periplasmic adaptor subunit [Shewanella litorisediminis]